MDEEEFSLELSVMRDRLSEVEARQAKIVSAMCGVCDAFEDLHPKFTLLVKAISSLTALLASGEDVAHQSISISKKVLKLLTENRVAK